MSPSRIDRILWSESRRDVRTRLALRVGERQAAIMQDYQTLSLIVSHAFGGGAEDSTPRDGSEAVAQFRSLFGAG